MIVGIDLGTTFSAVATLDAAGVPRLFPDRRDSAAYHTPSIVHIDERGALVGEVLERLLQDNPRISACRFAKRSMGKAEPVYVDDLGRDFTAPAVSSLVLRKLKIDAELAAGETIDKAVISVPAHFNETQRRATIDAGRLAGLPVAGLVEEPVAAATFCAAASKRAGERTLLVFDLGGGTLDATILHTDPDGLYVLATEGADNVGGKNFDEVIMEIITGQFRSQYRTDPGQDGATAQALRMFSTSVKLELSAPGCSLVRKPLLLSGRPLQVSISRAHFEQGSKLWLEACIDVCERVLTEARLDWSSLDAIVLTGGSSQLPCVEREVRSASGFGNDRIVRQHPRASIAYGAALLAAQKFGDKPTIAPPVRQSVSTNELGIRVLNPDTGKDGFHALIPKNRALPADCSQTIFADTTSQAEVAIHILQRKDEYSPPEALEQYLFGPVKHRARNLALELNLGYDSAGRVFVRVSHPASGTSLNELIDRDSESQLSDTMHLLNGIPIL